MQFTIRLIHYNKRTKGRRIEKNGKDAKQNANILPFSLFPSNKHRKYCSDDDDLLILCG